MPWWGLLGPAGMDHSRILTAFPAQLCALGRFGEHRGKKSGLCWHCPCSASPRQELMGKAGLDPQPRKSMEKSIEKGKGPGQNGFTALSCRKSLEFTSLSFHLLSFLFCTPRFGVCRAELGARFCISLLPRFIPEVFLEREFQTFPSFLWISVSMREPLWPNPCPAAHRKSNQARAKPSPHPNPAQNFSPSSLIPNFAE